MSDYSEFKKCTSTVFDGDEWSISCGINLWEVSGSCQHTVEDEALSYFRQYKADGEYSSIIGGKSVTELLA